MAQLINTTGRSSEGEGRRHRLANGDSALFDVVTISETTTIGLKSAQYLAVTASGASRNLDFLAAVEQNGAAQVVYNAGTTYNVVLRDSAGSTIATLLPGEWVAVVYDGSAWAVLVKAQAATLATIAPTVISLTDNVATALQVKEGSNVYLTFDTADSSESVRVHKVLELLASGIDMSQGNAGQSIYLKDNESAALDVAEGANVYLRFATTNGSEQVTVGKPVLFAGGLASACKFTSTEQTGTGSSQNIAHGLGSTPSLVWWSPSSLSGNACTFVPGAHDSTNIKMTVSSGEKYYVFAVK